MVLGQARWTNIQEMRDLAETTRARAKLGTDTLAEQRAERLKPRPRTLGELVEPYLKDRAPQLRKRSLYISTLYLRGAYWKALHRRPLEEIGRREIVPIIDDMKEARGAVTADRAKTVLSSLFGWAMDKGYVDANPCADIRNRAPTGGRTRVLTEDELVAVWKAAGGAGPFGNAVRLLMLTGARKTEIAGLLWPEVNFAERLLELPAPRVKINKPFLICLADPAIKILKAVPTVVGEAKLFAQYSASRYMDELRAKLPAGMAHWTLHDLRRSFSTHANELSLSPPHVIEAALGHVVGNKVAATYNRALYLEERRKLAAAWAAHLEWLLAGKPSRSAKVLPMKRGA
jgi:integrase